MAIHTNLRPFFKRWICGLVLSFLLAVPAAWADGLKTLDPRLFPLPQELSANVDFWTQVYSKYDNNVVLLHDELHLNVIYAALNFTKVNEGKSLSESRKRSLRRQEIRKAEAKYKSILADLAAHRVSKNYPKDQARVEQMFESISGGSKKYSAAAHRLRTQTCLKNRFAEAIERSGIYMPRMEAIFQQQGLPIEITRLPFVESLFQWNARSAVAAGGIWQFMPSTARSYLKLEIEYDERYDPLRATEAAATFLAENYAALQTWPLAITAYNHGRGGMKRAVRMQKTRDFGSIVTRYRSRTFGFASRNFYAEFIAAAQVYANRDLYFPGVAPNAEIDFEDFPLPLYASASHLAKGAGSDLDKLRAMNPALSSQVWNGNLFLPKKYTLRVPPGELPAFEASFEGLSSSHKSPHQTGLYYRVRSGDTLGKIAAKFGSSVASIQRANRLRSANRIRIGQRLLIPPRNGRRAPSTTTIAANTQPNSQPGTHVVRRGETLASISRRYGASVKALKSSNGLRGDRINIGQRLQVPSSGRTHKVQSGDTLTSIARHYGTSVQALQQANRLRGHLIRKAQILVIP
jgi:membrane-bound lytic murein transglycosylase D